MSGFLRARARAAAAPLVALAIVCAIAAGALVGMIGAARAVEASAIVAATDAASGDSDRVVVRVASDDDAAAVVDAVRTVLSAQGAHGALVAQAADDGAIVFLVDPARITRASAEALVHALPELRAEASAHLGDDLQVSGGLRATLIDVLPEAEATRGATAVAFGVVSLVAVIVVVASAIEPTRTRAGEQRLLRARGAGRRTLAGWSGLEALGVAGVGAAVGAAGGMLLARGALGVVLDASAGAVVVAAVVAVAVITGAVAAARGVDAAHTRADLGAGITLGILGVALTGVALWQFLEAGSPVVTGGSGAVAVDPLVALAPALVLGLTALGAVLLTTPLARAVARALSVQRGASPVTPLRLASRRPARHAVTTTVVAIAIGTSTLAAAFLGATQSLGDTPAYLRVGADVRVLGVGEAGAVPDVGAVPGVDATMAVRTSDARTTAGVVEVIAAQTATLGEVMDDAAGVIDAEAIATALTPPAVDEPAFTAAEFAVRIRTPDRPAVEIDGASHSPGPAPVSVSVWLRAADGLITVVQAQNFEIVVPEGERGVITTRAVRADVTVDIALPSSGPWAVAAIDVRAEGADQDLDGVRVDLRAETTMLDLGPLTAIPGAPGAVATTGDGLSFSVPFAGVESAEPVRAVSPAWSRTVPAVFTQDLAQALALEVGDDLSLRMSTLGLSVDFSVIEVIPVLPGAPGGTGVLTDLTAVELTTGAALGPDEVWASTATPAVVADEVEALAPATTTVAVDSRNQQDHAGAGLAFVVAAAGATLLALTVLALRRTRTRADSREMAHLAVLGLGRRGAARMRGGEEMFAVGTGVLGGIAAGVVTALLVVPPLVRSGTTSLPAAFPVALDVNALALGAVILLSAIAFLGLAATVSAPRALARIVREEE